MNVSNVEEILLFSVAALAIGWALFSLSAGFILYCSNMTTDRAGVRIKGLAAAERRSPMFAHTKEPRIMDAVNAAKERWANLRKAGTFKNLSVTARGGITLAGYYWAAERALSDDEVPTVLLAHGMMDSAAGMAYLAEEYHALGWNVLSVDLRSHGESEGTRRTMGVREGADLEGWVSLLAERYRARGVYLHGVSMGAAAVLLYAAKPMHASVRGIIADSAYARHAAVFARLLDIATGNRFLALSVTLGASVASLALSGVRFSQMAPARRIARVSVPVLFFHGQADALVPVGMARELFSDRLKPGSESVVIPDAPHIGPYFFAGNLYMRKVMEFYRRTR